MLAHRQPCLLLLALPFLASPVALAQAPAPAQKITSPKEHFGFSMGEDYCLANYRQLMTYWDKLARQSDRIKLVDIGETEEGRPQLMAIVTSPANQARLEHYRSIAHRLALAEELTEAQARRLAQEGKAVVWIDGGLHATETLCAQALIEAVYRFTSDNDPETLRILDDVIILFVHANPDGMDLVADWYMREKDPKKRSLSGLPRLYQKYAGHDNNRDFYANALAETRNMNRVLYREWFPQIMLNQHQHGPPGTVLFIPPFRDPFNYHIDPLVISGIDAVGSAIMQRLLAEGKPGATVRSGARYSTWYNGGLRTTTYYHNIIGLLTETIGSPTPTKIPFKPELQLPKGDYLAPIPPQDWHFRQSVEYTMSVNKAILDYASRHREQLLLNIWRMGRNAIEKGSRDNWTITPRIVAAAKGANPEDPKDFDKFFRDPDRRDPRGYILPSNQPDFLTAIKFANILLGTGIKVERATEEFMVRGKSYPEGSLVIRTAQAFRAHILDMFEPQDHPNDFAYPGGPPVAPYDIAGWTLAYQMGVHFDRILEGFSGPFEVVPERILPPPQTLTTKAAAGFLLDPRINDSYRVVNRLLSANVPVQRVTTSLPNDGKSLPPGSFYIPHHPTSVEILKKATTEFGVPAWACPQAPSPVRSLKSLRIALLDRDGGSMPSGWTRWIFDRFEFPYTVVKPGRLNAGKLADAFDVIVLPDGTLPTTSGPWLDHLQTFLLAGKTVLALGTATDLAKQLKLPLVNHLAIEGKDGKLTPLPKEEFYVPGSLLRMRLDSTHPLTWGLPEEVDVMFMTSPTFRLPESSLVRVGWYASAEPLRSGWAWGQRHLQGGVAIAEASVGKGRLILYGPHVLFRAQPHGTFKLFFNGLYLACSE